MKILLIDNDMESITRLRWRLERDNHTVLVALDGYTGLELARLPDVGLVISEVRLRGLLGAHIIKTIRLENRHVPFVFYSAFTDSALRLRLIYAGANLLLEKAQSKTIDWSALIQQFTQPSDAPAWLRLADLELNRVSRTAYRSGHSLSLCVREFQLLDYMLSHPNQVVTREQLFRAVWSPANSPNQKLVMRYMGRLREKLAATVNGPELIHTVVGGGYLLKDILQ